ncbi:MAG: hypothetical protein WCA13_18175 [Terriglobales bacterium]
MKKAPRYTREGMEDAEMLADVKAYDALRRGSKMARTNLPRWRSSSADWGGEPALRISREQRKQGGVG